MFGTRSILQKLMVHDIIFLIFIMFMFFSMTLVIFFFRGPLECAEGPSGEGIVEKALESLEKSQGFTFVINEEAQGYQLMFAGQVFNPDKLIGILRDYDLKVYRISEDLFVKNPLSEEWEMLKEEEMEDLNSFVQSPLYVLSHIYNHWPDYEEVRREYVGEKAYLVINYLPPEGSWGNLLDNYYPSLSLEQLKHVSCHLWIKEEEGCLYKIRFLLTLDLKEEGIQTISRDIIIKSPEKDVSPPLIF